MATASRRWTQKIGFISKKKISIKTENMFGVQSISHFTPQDAVVASTSIGQYETAITDTTIHVARFFANSRKYIATSIGTAIGSQLIIAFNSSPKT